MALCGFNSRMIEGLGEFGEGLYEQAKKKASEDGLSLRQSVETEIEETGIFLKMLVAKDPQKYEALIGVAHLARALYRSAQEIDQPGEVFLGEVKRLLVFFKELDDKYYRDFRPGNSPQVATEKLGQWLESRTTR